MEYVFLLGLENSITLEEALEELVEAPAKSILVPLSITATADEMVTLTIWMQEYVCVPMLYIFQRQD
jgi:hypothetical protein